MEVGGQAVIEGVMMRNKERFAVAVRLKNGSIKVLKQKSSKYPKLFSYPFIRGIVGLLYALYDGIKALMWSSNQQLEEKEQLTKREIIGTIIFSLLFAVAFFVIVPFFSARLISPEGFLFHALDGLFRVVLFLGYLLLISFLKDVKTLFKYHGAEHKTIYCYENKQRLTVENVKIYSRFHPRCGTSFIFIVLLLSVFLFSLIEGSAAVKLASRILLLPVIAGIGYELIKLSGRYSKKVLVKILISPGLWLQRITTKEPTDQQLEVGIAALNAVVD